MCKRRVKVLSSKSPGTHGAKTPQKAYKHIDMVQLTDIKRVVDIIDTVDCRNMFGLITKRFDDRERLYSFVLLEEIDKQEFLMTLCRHISNTRCRADYVSVFKIIVFIPIIYPISQVE